jgi:hypothetical protein
LPEQKETDQQHSENHQRSNEQTELEFQGVPQLFPIFLCHTPPSL